MGGEVRPRVSFAEGVEEVNGHCDDVACNDEVDRFFEQFPCDAEAQEQLRSCAPAVCGQVLAEFKPHALGKADYSRLLASFIGKVERSQRRSQGLRRGSPEHAGLGFGQVEGNDLMAFRERYPMDDEAFEVLLSMPDEHLQTLVSTFHPSTPETDYSRLLLSCSARLVEAPEAAAAEDSWHSLLPVGGSQTDVKHSLKTHREAGRWEHALACLEQMRRTGMNPETEDFNAVVIACTTAIQWEFSLALLEAMPAMHVVPDATSYQCVTAACTQAGQWAKAMALWDDMRQSGVSLSSISRRHVGETFRACEKMQHWTYALVLLDELRSANSTPSAANYRTALAACDQQGRWEHCIGLWEQMRSQGITPDMPHFTSAINSCMKGKLWEQSLSVLEAMEDKATPFHFETTIVTCKENQMWEVALRLLHRMLTVGPAPDRGCFTATITACAKGRADTSHWAYSLLLLERMMAPEIGVTERVGVVPSAGTFGEVMSAVQRGRQWEICLELFAQMQEIGLTPTYSCTHSAMRACDFSARWEHALAVYEQHVARSAELQAFDPGVDTLIIQCLIGSCEKAGQLHRLRNDTYNRLWRNAEQVLDDACAFSFAPASTGRQRASFKKSEGMMAIGYAHMAFTRLCCLDMQPSRSLQRWVRRVQRPLEGTLRELQPLVRPWGPLPPPAVFQDLLRCMNDLAHQFTGDVLTRMGLRSLHFPANSAVMAHMRRFQWWEFDRLPPDPEGWFVLAAIQYEVELGAGLPRLRCRSKIHYYTHMERCQVALAGVRMMQDRMQHRGWHAERQALLGLSFRMLLRYRALGDEEERKWPRGTVHLHVNHTPCLSCMAVIMQFQGRFPGLNFTVTFDVWQELRQHQQDPWHADWARWPPRRPPPRQLPPEPPPGPLVELPTRAPAATRPSEELAEPWDRDVVAFRARYPMNDRVFQVLRASPAEVQEALMDSFAHVAGGGAEDFSKMVMTQVVQLRRQLSSSSAQTTLQG